MKSKFILTLLMSITCFVASFAQANNPPSFVGGTVQSFSICQNSSNYVIDNYLTTQDADLGQTLTYTISTPPGHGTLHGFPGSGGTNGGVFSPSGFTYSPSLGYSGADAFTIQVSDGTATATTTVKITINTLPTITAITGTTSVCGSGTSTLADATTGGKWSSSNIFSSSIDSLTGVVTGISAGASTISYTITNESGCATTATTTFIVSGFPSVANITGTNTVCVGATTTLANSTTGGVWTSSNNTVATVSGGIVTGVAAGNATITYTVTNVYGCSTSVTRNVAVNASPNVAAITAASTNACIGATLTLTDATARGVWSGSNSSIATVSAGGIVTGVAAGTDTIFYTVTNFNGCSTASSVQITVSAAPTVAAITGKTTVCVNATTQLSDITASGVFTSSNVALATVSATGLVTGVAAGNVTITYTVTNAGGCSTAVTTQVTVSAAPVVAAIAGTNSVCVGSTTTLTDATTGGSWTSSNALIATVDNGGVVTGVSLGKDTISYTVSNGSGCSTIATFAVAVSSAISVPAITGSSSICTGATATLADATTGGVWSSSNVSVATIDASGVVTPVSTGLTVVKYTVGSGTCVGSASQNITINQTPTVAANSVANITICSTDSAQLTNATSGGVWSTGNATVATVTQKGMVTAVSLVTTGTGITYTVTNANGCAASSTTSVAVNAKPAAFTITGTNSTCIGTTSFFTTTGTGGTWSNSNTAVATMTALGNFERVTGVSTGTSIIAYTESNGVCSRKDSIILDVAAVLVVSPIVGSSNVCVGTNSTYTDSTTGGTWTVVNGTGTATITGGGVLNPTGAGTVTVTYTVNGRCSGSSTKTVTITAIPTVAAIAGPNTVCSGATITLTDATTGGVWTSGNTNQATVDPTTGIVTGVRSSGLTTNITYTFTNAGGCKANSSYAITVNTGANISGINGVITLCAGSTATFTDATTGGTWSSSNKAVATVNASTGLVTGVAGGTTVLQYIVNNANGCASVANRNLTINAVPTVLATTGTATVCAGQSTQLVNSSTIATGSTGAWSSSNTAIATVSTTGVVTGVAAGTVNIFFTVTNNSSLCSNAATTSFTVNALPVVANIKSASSTVCVGNTLQLTDATTGGVWGINDTTKAKISASGLITAITVGDVIATYTVTQNGCTTTVTGNGTVEPLPVVAAITGTTTLCQASTSKLADATASGVWTSSNIAVATVDATGIVTGIAAGTATITYTVTSAYGCVTAVTTSVTINPLPIVAAITGSSSVCYGSITSLADATASGVWSSTNKSIATVAGGTIATVAPGIDTISYTVTNGFGCVTTVTKPITVNATPVASFTINKTAQCLSGNFFVFNNTSTISAGSIAYSWTIDGKTIATASPTYTFTTAGKYVIKLVVTSGFGCADSTTQNVTVNPKPNPSFSINTANQCLNGNNYTFTNGSTISSGTETFGWKFGDGGVSAITSPSHSYTTAGTYTVKLTATSDSSCVDSTSQTVVLTANVTPSVSINASSTSICTGSNVIFTATPVNGGTPSYQWKKNGTPVGSNASTYNDNSLVNGDVITCVLTSNVTCVTATTATSNSITMAVSAYSTPSVSIVASATTICNRTSVTFTATLISGGASPTYQWQKNGVNVGSSATTYTDASLANGDKITCTLTSSITCVTIRTVTSNTITETVNQPTTATITKTVCSGYTWHGTTYTISGSYTFDSLSAKGCDSLTTLNLTVNYPTTATITKTVCSAYTWHGTTYTISGAYTFDSLNAKGCDSLTTLNLTVNYPTTATITKTVCSGYTWHGTTYTISGSYTFDSLNAKGCDSLTTLNLTVNYPTTATITKTVCSGYTWHGTTYIISGSYTFDSLNAKGCDSLTTLNLTVNYPTTATITKTLCSGYTWHGTTYTISGSYTFDSLNAKGCDSLTTLNLTVNYPTTATIAKTVCSGYTWHGTTYTISGSYTFDSLNVKGCDSLTTLNLTVNYPTTATITKTVCSGYTWHGTTYTISGSYTFDSLNAKGCDSLTTLNLTVNYPTTATITKTVCSGYTWHGTTYTISGSYTFDSINAKGCDSLTTLNLTVNYPTTSTTNASICSGSSYTFNRTTYITAGNYTAHLTNSVGCDSAATLVLTVKSLSTSTTTASINTGSSYTFNGTAYTKAGTYVAHLTNSVGCDSAATLILTVNASFTVSGNISNPLGTIIPNVSVILSNGNSTTTDASGNYNFTILPSSSYSVKPSKNNDSVKINGVTVLDALLIQGHILGKFILNSPYKIIAADVDNSGDVSVLDIIYTKRLILGIDTTFKGKRLWAFVDSAYQFADPTNPFPYKDTIGFSNLASSKSGQTFIGVKLGDVNYDWDNTVMGANKTVTTPIELYYNNINVGNEAEIRIPVRVKNFKNILGMQYTLKYNSKVLQLKSVENSSLNIEYGANHINEGKVSFLWSDDKLVAHSIDDNSVLMDLVFTKTGTVVNEDITLSSDITPIEAWDASYLKHAIVKTTGKLAGVVENVISKDNWDVSPNPSTGVIKTNLSLAEGKDIQFELTAQDGKVVLTKNLVAAKGNSSNTLNLQQQTKLTPGIYYLKAIGVDGENVKRIIIK